MNFPADLDDRIMKTPRTADIVPAAWGDDTHRLFVLAAPVIFAN
jgi:hypothetical protein